VTAGEGDSVGGANAVEIVGTAPDVRTRQSLPSIPETAIVAVVAAATFPVPVM
jgi:hypothetical protein